MKIYKEYVISETPFSGQLYLSNERLAWIVNSSLASIRIQVGTLSSFQIVRKKLADSDDLEYLLNPKGRGIHICFTIREITETEVVIKESVEGGTHGLRLHIPRESIHEYTTNLINNGKLHVGTIIKFNEADGLIMFYSKY